MSNLTYYGGDIPDNDPVLSAATPGLWNRRFSIISQNVDTLNTTAFVGTEILGTANQVTVASSATSATISLPSTLVAPGTVQVTSDLSTVGQLYSQTSAAVASDLSVGRSLYMTMGLAGAGSSATKPWRFSDTNMGFYRSLNSATLRFAGASGSNATMYVETPFRWLSGQCDSTTTFTEQIFSGAGGSIGGYAFQFAGTGMQQGSLGAINFATNGSPAIQAFGITSTGSAFLGATAISGSSQRIQLNGSISVATTGTSVTSVSLKACGLQFYIGGASGASIAISSGGTIFWFDSSGSTKG